jgi:hypothetical protein
MKKSKKTIHTRKRKTLNPYQLRRQQLVLLARVPLSRILPRELFSRNRKRLRVKGETPAQRILASFFQL